MSLGYQAVGWNRTKKIYDTVLAGGLGTAALLLLHVILCIGPLCRLDRRFLPLLYNLQIV